MRMTRRWPIAALFLMIYGDAMAVEEHVGVNAEKGDPARWYQPADTPQLKYENATKEARAALAEALKECREQADARGQCEADAREQFRYDSDRAKRFLQAGVSR
jgi:hypothetical protein